MKSCISSHDHCGDYQLGIVSNIVILRSFYLPCSRMMCHCWWWLLLNMVYFVSIFYVISAVGWWTRNTDSLFMLMSKLFDLIGIVSVLHVFMQTLCNGVDQKCTVGKYRTKKDQSMESVGLNTNNAPDCWIGKLTTAAPPFPVSHFLVPVSSQICSMQ